jgi:ribosome-binding factor A
MNNERLKKLERISKQLVSNFILESLEDSEKTFWIITITWVKISSDLSYLDIFVSSFLNSELLTKTLAKHNYEIQKRLNKSIDTRKLPKIRFRYDNSWKIWQDVCDTINNKLN